MKIHTPLLSAFLFGIILTLPLLSMSSQSRTQARTAQVSPTTISYTQIFRDDFDGVTLNSDVWQIYTNGGTISVDSGWVTLSRPGAADTFPYVHTKYNPIPSNGSFAVKIGFQYLSVTGHGDGFSVDDRLPANGSPGSWAWQPTIYTLWQDSSLGYVLFDHSGITRYYTQAPHLSYHDIEFRWLDSTDEYYIDGQLVNTVARDSNVPRPVDLWFGNPVIPPESLEWTSFKIDYIEVDSLGVPTPFFDLPINYSGRGNPTQEQFLAAWQGCTTSFFDHRYPLETVDNGKGDGYLVPFWGEVIPAGYDLFKNSYDGHEGYDFDDLSRCGGTPVFPVASGTILNAFCDRFSTPPYNYRGYGCQVRIRHGDSGYESLYGHLQEDAVFANTKSRIGTTVATGEQIGTIGCTGKCYGSHLHLRVDYQGKPVDPSGWEPMPWYDDPYVANGGGPTSYRLWRYSPRRSMPVNDSVGTTLVSPSGSSIISIPSNAYGEDYMIAMTELAPISLPMQLASANHAFVLQAQNFSGQAITSLNQDVTVEVHFSSSDVEGIRANTLSLYTWSATLNKWIPLTTTISLHSAMRNGFSQNAGTATATTRDIGYVALLGEPYLTYLPVVIR